MSDETSKPNPGEDFDVHAGPPEPLKSEVPTSGEKFDVNAGPPKPLDTETTKTKTPSEQLKKLEESNDLNEILRLAQEFLEKKNGAWLYPGDETTLMATSKALLRIGHTELASQYLQQAQEERRSGKIKDLSERVGRLIEVINQNNGLLNTRH